MHRFSPALIALVILVPPAVAQDVAWQADLTSADAYRTYREDSGTTIAHVDIDGEAALDVTTPGEQALEGICFEVPPPLEGGRRYSFQARVRGTGRIWPMARSRNGWLYARDEVELGDNWQLITLTKPLDPHDDRMTACLLTRQPAQVHLQIRAVQVLAQPVPQTWDAEVPPVRFEAEEASIHADRVREIDGASGGRAVADSGHMILTGMPVPRTSREIFVHARVRMADADAVLGVMATTPEGAQRISEMRATETGQWQWITSGPLTAAMLGDELRLQYYGAKPPSGDGIVDAIAISTNPQATATMLDEAPVVHLSGEPMFTAARADRPPTLDGVADDPCWQSTVVVSNFLRNSTFTPAVNASEMRFCWDDENLYWFFRGESQILRPELNRLHEFLKNVTERDDRVYRDDSVLLILDPRAPGGERFDVTLNAIGTVGDARIIGEDLWRGRDPEFDAEVSSASVIGDGFWTVEASISFASLGVQPPAVGESWRAIVGRVEHAEEERSSWNMCRQGFHDPQAFATMRFAGSSPLVQMQMPERLQLGGNPIGVTVRSEQPTGLYAYSRLESGETFASSFSFLQATPETASTSSEITIEEEGEIGLSYGVWDAVAARPLMISPVYPRNVRSSVAEIALATDSPWTLYLNGAPVARGQSSTPDEPIRAFLQKGVNAFGLRVDGRAQVRITAGDFSTTSGEHWRVAPDDVVDFSAPTLDPREWPTATVVGEGEIGPIIGSEGATTRLRFTLLWENTRIFPNPTPALFIARGTEQHFTVPTNGIPGHVLPDYRCRIALPDGLELTRVTGYYNTREEQPEYTLEVAGQVEIGGETLTEYVVSADQPISYSKTVRILELFNAFVAWDEAAGEPEDRVYVAYFASEALGGGIQEPWQALPIRVMPALEGAQPQRLVWQIWGSFFSAMNRRDAKQATLETCARAGFNNIVSGDAETSELGDTLGIDNVLTVNFQSWSIDMRPWLEQNPGSALVDRQMVASDSYVCPSALLDEAWPHADARLRAMIAERRPDVVNWDYESNVMTSYLSCFCPRCLAAFGEHSGIADAETLTPEEIEQEHLDAWTEFMNLRMAQVALRMKETSHAAEPSAQFAIYSGYQSEDTKWRYGVDWAMIGELGACDYAECGYGWSWENITATHEALDGIPLVLGTLMRPYDRNSDDVPVPATKAELLRRLMDSTGGILIYDRMPIDGRTWHASAEASRLAAAYEDVIAAGEFARVEGLPFGEQWMATRSLGDTLLIGVFNLTGEETTRRFTIPDGYATCRGFYTGDAPQPGLPVEVTLPPGEAEVYVLER